MLVCVHRGSAGTQEHSILISNVSSSAHANYNDVLDSPIQVSAIETVGVDAECQAKVSWNISIKTGTVCSCVFIFVGLHAAYIGHRNECI